MFSYRIMNSVGVQSLRRSSTPLAIAASIFGASSRKPGVLIKLTEKYNALLSCILSEHMLIRLTAFMGSKPSSSYFKRDFCTANLHQKVPKKSELFDHKKSSRTIFLQCGSNFSLILQGNQVFSLHKHEKCRICLVDKFGTYHVCAAPNGVRTRVFAPNGVRGHKLYYLAYFASVLNGSTYPKCVYAEPKSSSIRFV